jgi:hypothetical protein
MIAIEAVIIVNTFAQCQRIGSIDWLIYITLPILIPMQAKFTHGLQPEKWQQKTYQCRKKIYYFVVIAIILLAPIDRFLNRSFHHYWPYFNWELGFGSVPFRTQLPMVYIEEIDQDRIEPPQNLYQFLLDTKSPEAGKWIQTQDYKLAMLMAQAVSRKDDAERDRLVHMIVHRWLRNSFKEQVKFYLALVYRDPLEYRKNQSTLHKEILYRHEYRHAHP